MKFDLTYTQKQPAWPGSPVSFVDRKLKVIDEGCVEKARKAVEEFLATQAGTTVAIGLYRQDEADPKVNYLTTTREQAALIASIEDALAAVHVEEDGGAGTFETGVTCRIYQCPGKIVKEVRREYRGDPMHQIIGPGYKNQLSTVTKYYCPVCQIMYRSLPAK